MEVSANLGMDQDFDFISAVTSSEHDIVQPLVLPQCQLCTHHSTALTSDQQKKCAGTQYYCQDHNSPCAIQSHSGQGQAAIQSHPSQL